jgi:membrane peptidoglycan carboxypeptidase
MPRRSAGSKFFIVAVCGALAGWVLAAAALPAAAVAGLATKYVFDAYNRMPSELKIPPPAQASRLYAKDGKTLITRFYEEDRHVVPLSKVSPLMQRAMVAAEDRRFYQHGGVDLRSVVRAFVSNVKGNQNEQGASTLTMQYVRNVLKGDEDLTPQQRIDATANTLRRKVQEMRYAQALEKRMSKQEILERYLNIAYFGAGAYGVESASQRYFGKPASALNLPEAALIAGLVQSPDTDNPISGDRTAALNRRGYVLDSMVEMKVITPEQAARAKATPLALKPKADESPNGCTSVPEEHNDWGFFCDYFVQWWDSHPEFGETEAERETTLKRGGYDIVTSLDPKIQAVAQSSSVGVYGYGSPRALPLAVVQPGTGHVLAMAVNKRYSLAPGAGNTVNQLVGGGGGVNGYQAGSTFKMFTMLAALESGHKLSTTFNAPARFASKFPASGHASCGGRYCPANANPSWMDGPRTMWTGFGRSVNTYFVWLEQQVGPKKAVEMAKRLGIKFRSRADARLANTKEVNIWGSFTLGVSDTTPLDLANAYATLAADGIYCQPLPVLSVKDADGRALDAAKPSCHRAISADVARAGTDAARCPVGQQSAYGKCDGGTAAAVGALFGKRPVAGKTGSSEGNATETFVGFTPQIAAAATAANPDSPQDAVGEGVSSSVNMAVARTMAAALKGQPEAKFKPPSRGIAG